jgi:hypothetical protein
MTTSGITTTARTAAATTAAPCDQHRLRTGDRRAKMPAHANLQQRDDGQPAIASTRDVSGDEREPDGNGERQDITAVQAT